MIKTYSKNEFYTLYSGDMNDINIVIADNSIDAIVCDPPYELGFMGKSWDASRIAFSSKTWKHCFNVLKPGGHLLAFGGSRTFHRIACAIEDAGFEIRDTIMWLYGSGFPKSMNIGLAIDKKNGVESNIVGEVDCPNIKGGAYNSSVEKNNGERELRPIKTANNEWNGWGTALKPSYEPIIVARKPCDGTCVDNVLKWGVGGINIDECRIATTDYLYNHGNSNGTVNSYSVGNFAKAEKKENRSTELGRFPANTILTYNDEDYDEVCGGFPETKCGVAVRHNSGGNTFGGDNKKPPMPDLGYNDEGSASRYFYCAKTSKRDRDEGLDGFEVRQSTGGGGGIGDYLDDVNSCSGKYGSEKAPARNFHPTVKPTALMSYLIRLVSPKGATILDPFMGSGSTGKAVMLENRYRNTNYKFIGIELTGEYLPIAKARIDYAIGYYVDDEIDDNVDQVKNEELTLFNWFKEEK